MREVSHRVDSPPPPSPPLISLALILNHAGDLPLPGWWEKEEGLHLSLQFGFKAMGPGSETAECSCMNVQVLWAPMPQAGGAHAKTGSTAADTALELNLWPMSSK